MKYVIIVKKMRQKNKNASLFGEFTHPQNHVTMNTTKADGVHLRTISKKERRRI